MDKQLKESNLQRNIEPNLSPKHEATVEEHQQNASAYQCQPALNPEQEYNVLESKLELNEKKQRLRVYMGHLSKEFDSNTYNQSQLSQMKDLSFNQTTELDLLYELAVNSQNPSQQKYQRFTKDECASLLKSGGIVAVKCQMAQKLGYLTPLAIQTKKLLTQNINNLIAVENLQNSYLRLAKIDDWCKLIAQKSCRGTVDENDCEDLFQNHQYITHTTQKQQTSENSLPGQQILKKIKMNHVSQEYNMLKICNKDTQQDNSTTLLNQGTQAEINIKNEEETASTLKENQKMSSQQPEEEKNTEKITIQGFPSATEAYLMQNIGDIKLEDNDFLNFGAGEGQSSQQQIVDEVNNDKTLNLDQNHCIYFYFRRLMHSINYLNPTVTNFARTISLKKNSTFQKDVLIQEHDNANLKLIKRQMLQKLVSELESDDVWNFIKEGRASNEIKSRVPEFNMLKRVLRARMLQNLSEFDRYLS